MKIQLNSMKLQSTRVPPIVFFSTFLNIHKDQQFYRSFQRDIGD